MTRQLKPWDSYVEEARRDPLLLPIPDGQLTINQPSGAALRQVAESQENNDVNGAAFALFGEENGRVIMKLFDDAPMNTLNNLINDVLEAFTGVKDSGESQTSSS